MKDSFNIRNLRRYLIELEEAEAAKKNRYFGVEPITPTAPLASNIIPEEPKKEEPEEEKLPYTPPEEGESAAEGFAALTESLKNQEAAETRGEVKESAEEAEQQGNAYSESAGEKNSEIYEALSAFVGKQDGRYDSLIAAILADPAASEAGRAVLERYREAGESQARHTLAEQIAENGGNPDSYAATQAKRGLLDYRRAGEEAAAALYGEQLDRMLTALGASSKDLADLFGLMQDNADADADLAGTHLGMAESLFSSLMDAENKADEISSEKLIELFDEITGNTHLGNISPMQIDDEYYALIGDGENGGHSVREALLILWDKYPSMRAYITKKYDFVTGGDFIFS